MVEPNPNNHNHHHSHNHDHGHGGHGGHGHGPGGCNCAEEMKNQDPNGEDLFPCILMSDVECFNEANVDSAQKVLRPIEQKRAFLHDESLTMKADYGTELVVKIPFNSEVKVKSICVAGGHEGDAPSKMKVYKNEENVDFSIIEDKRPV